MPTLDWIGKDKVINHHKDVPYKVLERKYSFDESGMHKDDIHSNNMIIHGDNLEALKSLLPQYEGKIKCIYIDPPYNTGNEGWIYNDNVNDPKIRKWLGEVVGKEGEDLSRHDKWLCMMYPRLVLLQKLLADDGAIFISIDDNEQAFLKCVCDEIFGARNFVAQLVWQRTFATKNDAKYFSSEHEYILVYAAEIEKLKIKALPKSDKQLERYKNPDNDPRGPWISTDLLRMEHRDNSVYEVPTPQEFGGTTDVFLFGKDNFGLLDICGNVSEWCEDVNLDNEREHLAYGVSWNNSQGENIKAYKYKWSQLGAVSVGFRVFFD